jgi:hypothetical protein
MESVSHQVDYSYQLQQFSTVNIIRTPEETAEAVIAHFEKSFAERDEQVYRDAEVLMKVREIKANPNKFIRYRDLFLLVYHSKYIIPVTNQENTVTSIDEKTSRAIKGVLNSRECTVEIRDQHIYHYLKHDDLESLHLKIQSKILFMLVSQKAIDCINEAQLKHAPQPMMVCCFPIPGTEAPKCTLV